MTYHGPGQLVLYPILNLRQFEADLHWYLRTLEDVVIDTLAEFGLQGERIEGLTGVWVDGAKVGAIGVRAKRWITYHGLALNVTTDLSPFRDIVPCGIEDRPVTSMYDLLIRQTRYKQGERSEDVVNGNEEEEECAVIDKDALLKQVAATLMDRFAHLFDVNYVSM